MVISPVTVMPCLGLLCAILRYYVALGEISETSRFPPLQNLFKIVYRTIQLPGNHCRRFTKLTLPFAYTVHSGPIPQTDNTNGHCDLSYTFHKQIANVSQHVFVILLWGILTSPLKRSIFQTSVDLSPLSDFP